MFETTLLTASLDHQRLPRLTLAAAIALCSTTSSLAGLDQARLRQASAGLRKRSGTVLVQFCVDTRGHVEPGSVEISRSFGDPAVDDIARATVGRWRFAPMKVDDQPRRACSQAQFDIRFN